MKDELEISTEEVYEFELTEDISLFYDHENKVWYICNFDENFEGNDMYLLEDQDNDLEDEVEVFGIKITKEMIQEYKELLSEEIE